MKKGDRCCSGFCEKVSSSTCAHGFKCISSTETSTGEDTYDDSYCKSHLEDNYTEGYVLSIAGICVAGLFVVVILPWAIYRFCCLGPAADRAEAALANLPPNKSGVGQDGQSPLLNPLLNPHMDTADSEFN